MRLATETLDTLKSTQKRMIKIDHYLGSLGQLKTRLLCNTSLQLISLKGAYSLYRDLKKMKSKLTCWP